MPGGRPTLYKPENADIARLACMLGATNEALAERFEVSPRTVAAATPRSPKTRTWVASCGKVALVTVHQRGSVRHRDGVGHAGETSRLATLVIRGRRACSRDWSGGGRRSLFARASTGIEPW